MSSPEREMESSTSLTRFRRLLGEFLRFLVMGGINTLVAYIVYLILLNWMRYEIAYSLGYAVGICVAYALSAVFVFRKPMSKRSAVRFPLVYVVQFLISLGLLKIAVDWIHLPEWFAFCVAVVLTIPATFLMTRHVVHSG